ncbi:zinc-binding alcohol dehydrogenase family protein [Paracoccus shanxieyensis]|uniref:Alcohol dehydrogenase catalytic domain-containing protein n=1 Tax=Paracoccus shanxieyensis TaxID=2675752 RepID=A0A6L6IZN2_9RHOB|nr:zinc-binding alcohol dehydrogenase family protein [Paracoccus shanxieyensis]MTH64490.1 alcohol dehydrogenase catalytic domain-containing protein [Paracoccus shanxieyensis]MTH87517.1 alcohol dehydrogenase catalytic domain-containing protein [Paracoccus shanxieyensis]
MKALICNQPGELALIDRPDPEPAAGEVLVRIRHVGICGTDFHIFGGKHPFLEYPRVMGHELSGTVEAAPEGSDLQPGDPVYIVPYLSCGDCQACRIGLTNACRNIRVLGVHTDGGMAERISVPAQNVIPTGGIALRDAAMIEFLAIGAHGVSRGHIAAHDRVLVTGAGPIGMSAIIFAKARGAHVTVMDTREDRLAFATGGLGADASVIATSDQADALARGDGFDVVIDATGVAAPMMRGFDFLAHGARYVLLSVVRQEISFSDPEFHKREATLIASRNALPADFAEVVAQMQAGHVPTEALNTHRGPIRDGVDLFKEWSRPEAGVIKAILDV